MVEKITAHRTTTPAIRILRILLRSVQILVALIIIGIYSHELRVYHSSHPSSKSSIIYAIIVGVLSIVTAAVYLLPNLASHKFCPWDAVLFILWAALFGVTGKVWVDKGGYGGMGRNMRAGTWINMVGMLLWFASAVGMSPPPRTERSW